jgi:hydroxymethylglutaryl-CoA reductase (NADPH)
MTAPARGRDRIPRTDDDYSRAAAAQRLAFLANATGVRPDHVGRYSADPASFAGNIENFVGVAQVPIGVAGPLLVDGEHARGEFYVPLATTEGTLVASYNRGMKLLHSAGGVRATVVDDVMQRAPAFGFDSAREARAFGEWVTANVEAIRRQAQASTRTGRLHDIEQFSASSQINILRTCGKRVIAEATLSAALVAELMHTTPERMFQARQVSNLGGMMAGVNNNGNHSANGITAMFVATGQDIANVAESSAGLVHTELLPDGGYYYSITIPALIVATYGGGTGLPTQRECLELLGCYGAGQVRKFAEIVAATVLCGEISLGAAVVADEWVAAHERLGRNRP